MAINTEKIIADINEARAGETTYHDTGEKLINAVELIVGYGSRYMYKTTDGRTFNCVVIGITGNNTFPVVAWDETKEILCHYANGYAFRDAAGE